MGDINSIFATVKFLEKPRRINLTNGKKFVEVRVHLPQARTFVLAKLVCWGNMGQKVFDYCDINSYLIVQGYISFETNVILTDLNTKEKIGTINLLKFNKLNA